MSVANQNSDQARVQRRQLRLKRIRADKTEAVFLTGVFSGVAGITHAFGASVYKYSESMQAVVMNPQTYEMPMIVGGAVAVLAPLPALAFTVYQSHKARVKKIALPVAFAAFSLPAVVGNRMTTKLLDVPTGSVTGQIIQPHSPVSTVSRGISYITPRPQQS